MLTYAVLQGSQESKPLELRFDLRTPPEWLLILLHGVVAYFYVEIFFGLDRMERLAMAQQFASYKFAQLMVPLTISMDVIILLCGNSRKSMLAIGLALCLALITGNRSFVDARGSSRNVLLATAVAWLEVDWHRFCLWFYGLRFQDDLFSRL